MNITKTDCILALCASYRVKGYYTGQDDLIGVQHKGRILWFRWESPDRYEQTGSTDTPQGAIYNRLPPTS